MYGTQTRVCNDCNRKEFENDVKMYGTQTAMRIEESQSRFENDVKMYGTQTRFFYTLFALSLRMM